MQDLTELKALPGLLELFENKPDTSKNPDPLQDWVNEQVTEYKETIKKRKEVSVYAEASTLQIVGFVSGLLVSPYGVLPALSLHLLIGSISAFSVPSKARCISGGLLAILLGISASIQWEPIIKSNQNVAAVRQELGLEAPAKDGAVLSLCVGAGALLGLGALSVAKK
jgi:hypothetical protein